MAFAAVPSVGSPAAAVLAPDVLALCEQRCLAHPILLDPAPCPTQEVPESDGRKMNGKRTGGFEWARTAALLAATPTSDIRT